MENIPREAYLLLGSNLGDREAVLAQARSALALELGPFVSASGMYETEPWSMDSSLSFLNQVVIVSTALSATDVVNTCLSIEASLGRTRTSGVADYTNRIIDIDVLYLGSLIVDGPEVCIPHPRLHLRRFTLVPLTEIRPDFVHPRLQRSQSELLERCPDTSFVHPWK